MKSRDKVFIFGSLVVLVLLALVTLVYDTPIQKAAKEYERNGDLTIYEYR